MDELARSQTELSRRADLSVVERALAAWLHASRQRSGSVRTWRAYQATILDFRQALLAAGLDLDHTEIVKLALLAQGWAAHPHPQTGKPVTAATFNQRLAVVSSFYRYTLKTGLWEGENPILRLDRARVQPYGGAAALDRESVRHQLAAIDRSTLMGKRDFALLALFLGTGRRLSEVAALRLGDLERQGERVTAIWRRVKGGKIMRDVLVRPLVITLDDYLAARRDVYANEPLTTKAPLWISLSRNGTAGHPLTLQAIADICAKRLNISKVHALRHTFAVRMEEAGAPVSLIQARLGHASLQTTGIYLNALRHSDNPYADAILDGLI